MTKRPSRSSRRIAPRRGGLAGLRVGWTIPAARDTGLIVAGTRWFRPVTGNVRHSLGESESP